MLIKKLYQYTLLASILVSFVGCVTVKVEPIKIEMDVTLKIEKELDDFFGDLDAQAESIVAKGI